MYFLMKLLYFSVPNFFLVLQVVLRFGNFFNAILNRILLSNSFFFLICYHCFMIFFSSKLMTYVLIAKVFFFFFLLHIAGIILWILQWCMEFCSEWHHVILPFFSYHLSISFFLSINPDYSGSRSIYHY